jgi:single-strand DNA-binding protein
MSSLNKAMILGKLGRDPEIKYLSTGTPICNFSVATTERWKTDGKMQEATEWHKIVVWGKLAEICAEHLSKGRSVYVEGRIQTRQWEDKSGEKRYSTEIAAKEVLFLGGKNKSQEREPGSDDDFVF